jgi:hypothetical protein
MLVSTPTQLTPTGTCEPFVKNTSRAANASSSEVFIGVVSVSGDATWTDLKLRLKALFKVRLFSLILIFSQF